MNNIDYFQNIGGLPEDPILITNKLFIADQNPDKVNLGIGVITDEIGSVYSFSSLRDLKVEYHKGYLPMQGDVLFLKKFQEIFLPFVKSDNILSFQSVGGTYANFLAAKLLYKAGLKNIVFPKPTWGNHLAIFEGVGLNVGTISYYDLEDKKISDEFLLEVEKLPENTVLSLDVCGHNPTGTDLSNEQIEKIIEIGKRKNFVYFLDGAYVGLVGESFEEDLSLVKKIYESGSPLLLAFSFSKNMSLYGQRLGVLSIMNVGDNFENIASNLSHIVRSQMSSPPRIASDLALQVFENKELFSAWKKELDMLRNNLIDTRDLFVSELEKKGIHYMSELKNQRGLFSLVPELKVEELREKHSIYLPPGGRINISGLKKGNIEKVVQAIVETSS